MPSAELVEALSLLAFVPADGIVTEVDKRAFDDRREALFTRHGREVPR